MATKKTTCEFKWIWLGSLKPISCDKCETGKPCETCLNTIKETRSIYKSPHRGPMQLFPNLDSQNSKVTFNLDKFVCESELELHKITQVKIVNKTELFRLLFDSCGDVSGMDAKNAVRMVVEGKDVPEKSLETGGTRDSNVCLEFNAAMKLIVTWMGLKWTFEIPKTDHLTIQTTIPRDAFLKLYTSGNLYQAPAV